MDARLAALSGPLKGSAFPLEAEETVVGRDAGADISVPDGGASRRHCAFRRTEGGGFSIHDLGSLNGTFVNGVPVQTRSLAHGDRIEAGRSTFIFLSHADAVVPEGDTLTWRDDPVELPPTIRVPAGNAPASAFDAPAALALLDRALLAVSIARTSADLAAEAADIALSLVPADRCAIVWGSERAPEILPLAARARGGAALEGFRASRTLLAQLTGSRDALIVNDIERDERWGAVASVISGEARAILAAPVVANGRVEGAFIAEALRPGNRFEESHARMLLALGRWLGPALESATRREWLDAERRRLEAEAFSTSEMVGESAAIREVLRTIARVAPTDAAVLIRGESGTGKELVARAIHRGSRRADRPFVAINGASLSESLLESELFGHERGAFTGAIAQKKGKLEIAHGGTVFLDEVGELPAGVQARLLRVLQEREFERVGGTRPIRVDIRLIAATNRDLEAAMREGRFRDDLFYRLNVISITVPPLRDRREDVALLASHFASRAARRVGRPIAGFTEAAREALARHDWPGNVRELANAIESAVILGGDEAIAPEDLPEAVVESAHEGGPAAGSFQEKVHRAKVEAIVEAVEEAGGNLTEAARRLDLHPNYLHRLIRKLNVRPLLPRREP
jgi:transcriptional regulator with GAF, ATPase, and Fis domain